MSESIYLAKPYGVTSIKTCRLIHMFIYTSFRHIFVLLISFPCYLFYMFYRGSIDTSVFARIELPCINKILFIYLSRISGISEIKDGPE